mmetsp:Transcript_50143/g.93728  ORF Transcript_50143/g.93728 Transcript_50143/m.93728 type:complete len:243 (-) Transcript_50143:248-976(-)
MDRAGLEMRPALQKKAAQVAVWKSGMSKICIPVWGRVLPRLLRSCATRLLILNSGQTISHGLGACRSLLVLSIRLACRGKRRLVLPAKELFPTQVLEEGVRFQLCIAFVACPQALFWISCQETFYEAHDLVRHVLLVEPLRKAQLGPQDLMKNLSMVRAIACKREVANDELVQTNSQTPEIRNSGVALSENHLRSHEHWGSLERAVSGIGNSSCNTKVNDLQVALLIDQTVLALEIQICYAP